ncbi:MAG: nucleotide-binding domain containing protein, partial [Tistlia sp.]
NHPLTPMTDPDIRRWLTLQTRLGVGHVPYQTIAEGAAAVTAALEAEVGAGRPVVVLDAVADGDLRVIGEAAAGVALVTGGSGVALGLPANFEERSGRGEGGWEPVAGPGVVLSGSCSAATRGQVSAYSRHHPALAVEPLRVLTGEQTAAEAADWVLSVLDAGPMVYSTADPEAVSALQASHGRDAVASAVETFFAELAALLAGRGLRRFVVAGGETSGAVTAALKTESLRIGPEIAPGVPALFDAEQGLALALKSGNFGAPDFFESALAVLGPDR